MNNVLLLAIALQLMRRSSHANSNENLPRNSSTITSRAAGNQSQLAKSMNCSTFPRLRHRFARVPAPQFRHAKRPWPRHYLSALSNPQSHLMSASTTQQHQLPHQQPLQRLRSLMATDRQRCRRRSRIRCSVCSRAVSECKRCRFRPPDTSDQAANCRSAMRAKRHEERNRIVAPEESRSACAALGRTSRRSVSASHTPDTEPSANSE